MVDDFDWSAEGAPIVVPQVDAIAIYRNPDGDAVIRQRSPLGEEDWVVILPPSSIPAVIAGLRAIRKK